MVYFETEPERFRFAQGKKGKFLRVQTVPVAQNLLRGGTIA